MFADPTDMRIKQLARDGYVECVNQRWLLTEKGWRTLSAAADPHPPPIKQSKTEIECELRKHVLGIIAGSKWR